MKEKYWSNQIYK